MSPKPLAERGRPKLEKWVGENFRPLVGSGSPFLKDVYGMTVDLKTAEFIPWTTLIERFVFDKDEPYFNIMVPTADTTRYDLFFLLNNFLAHQRASCLAPPTRKVRGFELSTALGLRQ